MLYQVRNFYFNFILMEEKKLDLTVGNLKSEFLEKPFVFSGLISFFKLGLDMCFRSFSFSHIFNRFLVNKFLVQVKVNRVASWHDMIVVDNFNKWFHLVSFSDLLFTHRFGDFSWVTIDASNKSMSVKAFLSTFIGFFDNYCLFTSVFTGGEDNNTSRFNETSHDFLVF